MLNESNRRNDLPESSKQTLPHAQAAELSEPPPIPWNDSEDAAQEKAAARRWPVMAYFGCAPECGDSLALETVTFRDPRVVQYIEAHLVPMRLARQEQDALAERYNAAQTPVVLLTDSNGHVYSRIEGFLPPDEFLARLSVGVGALECGLAEAPPTEAHVDAAPASGGGSEVAAQALYWQAAARFRRTGDTGRLRADWQAIATRFPNSVWACRTRLAGTTHRAAS